MTTSSPRTPGYAGPRTTVQKAALFIGAVSLPVDVLGCVPGITSQYDALGVAGRGPMAMLLGVFQVSIRCRPRGLNILGALLRDASLASVGGGVRQAEFSEALIEDQRRQVPVIGPQWN